MEISEDSVSQSLHYGLLLALSGGLMDAYSYIGRGKVFANAQTGNILLLAVHISQKEFSCIPHYLIPVCCFALGIALAEVIHMKKHAHMHWKQHVLLMEAGLLVLVSFCSDNLLANSLTSLVCGLQVQSFRKLHEQPFATTMCIGNLRNSITALVHFCISKDKQDLKVCAVYFLIIVCFALGAVAGNYFLAWMHSGAILISALLLMSVFGLMQIQRKRKEASLSVISKI